MLGIPTELLPQIAAQPTAHSWIHPLLETSSEWTFEIEDKVETRMHDWIEKLVKKEFPQREDHYMLTRLTREAMLPAMEMEAVRQFLFENPYYNLVIPRVTCIQEAVYVAGRDAMSEEEQDERAVQLLEKIVSGEYRLTQQEMQRMIED